MFLKRSSAASDNARDGIFGEGNLAFAMATKAG
jgi:hypothetical protein